MIIWSLGLLSANVRFLSPVLRPNIVVLPMLFLRFAGFVTYFLSFIVLFQLQLLFIVIMLVLSICRATLFIINALSTLKLTFILFVKKFNMVMFAFLTFHLDIRLPTFLPRVYHKFFLMIFATVSMFANLPVRLQRCNRIKYFVYFVKSSYLIIILYLFSFLKLWIHFCIYSPNDEMKTQRIISTKSNLAKLNYNRSKSIVHSNVKLYSHPAAYLNIPNQSPKS